MANLRSLRKRKIAWQAEFKAMYWLYLKIGVIVNLTLLPFAVFKFSVYLPATLVPYQWAVFAGIGFLVSVLAPVLLVYGEKKPYPTQ